MKKFKRKQQKCIEKRLIEIDGARKTNNVFEPSTHVQKVFIELAKGKRKK